MTARSLATSFAILVALIVPGVSWADDTAAPAKSKSETKKKTGATKETTTDKDKDKSKDQDKPKGKGKTEKATFGAGCFWSVEAVFERIPGVKSVVSGFSGGNVPSPSYEMVCTGQTGHAEAVQVEFDPDVIPYDKLLKVFWAVHDPTTLNSQGDDFGTQYRSVIFYHSEAQKEAALKSYKDLTKRRVYRDPIVTDLVPFSKFFPAEAYHQDYYRNNLYSDYSTFYIAPKLKKLKLK